MTNQADIVLRVRSDTRGAQQAAQAVRQVRDDVRRVKADAASPILLTTRFDAAELGRARAALAGLRTAAPPIDLTPKVDTRSVQQAERDIARLATVQSSAAARVGDYARANETLVGALARVSAGSAAEARIQGQLAGVQRQQAQALDRSAAAASRQRREQQQTADSEIRAARATGDHARALNLIGRELNQASAGTARYNNLLVQKAGAEQRAARETERAAAAQARANRAQQGAGQPALPRTFAGVTRQGVGAIAAGAGALGLAAGAAEMLRFGVEAGQAANQLEKTQALVRALSGNMETYATVVRIAQQNQRTYGGSLNDNLAPLGRLAPLARNTGAEIEKLDQAMRLLALASPEQGLEGANVALREFLSGNGSEAVLSLAERFELPRKALQELSQEGVSAQARLTGLFALLEKQGLNADALAAGAATTAGSYDRLGGAAHNLTDSLGALISEGLEPLAVASTAALQATADGLSALRRTEVKIEGLEEAAQTYEEYTARIEAANRAQAGTNQFTASLTEEQFKLAQAYQASGISAEEAAKRAAGTGVLFRDIASAQQLLTEETGRSGAEVERLGAILQTFAGQGAAQTATVQALVIAYLSGTIGVEQFIIALERLQIATGQGTAATNGLALAEQRAGERSAGLAGQVTEAGQALGAEIKAKLESTAAAERLGDAQETLAKLGGLVAGGMLASGEAALLLARQYGIAREEAARLLALQAQLAGRTDPAATATEGRAERDRASDRVAVQNVQRDAITRAEEARRDQLRQTGTQVQKIRLAEQELSEARRRFGANSAEAIRAETELRQARSAGVRTPASGVDASTRADLNATNDLIAQRDILERKLSKLTAGSNQYKNVLGQILDLDTKIADAKDKQVRSALDLRIASIEDRKERREEDQRLAQAQRIIADASTSDEQKAAARDVQELIPLDRERRELDLNKTAREAGAATVEFAAGAVQVLIDGKPVEARIVTNFRGAVAQAQAQGGG